MRRVHRSVIDYQAHWDSSVRGLEDAAHPEGVLRFVALGDSAAQGVGATTPDAGYVPRVARELEEATGRPVALYNLSVSGATARDVVATQLPLLAALGFTPDLLTLDIGGNDVMNRSIAPADFGDGASGHFLTSTVDPAGTDRLEILFDAGKVLVEDSRRVTITRFADDEEALSASVGPEELPAVISDAVDLTRFRRSETSEYTSAWGEQHCALMANVAASICGEAGLLALLAAGLDQVRLVDLDAERYRALLLSDTRVRD